MNKVSKKYKQRNLKKTNLYKNKIKTKKEKLYNLIGGSIKDARNLFKDETNFNKIKPYLKKEKVFNDIRLEKDLPFDKDFNVTKIKISKGGIEYKDNSCIEPLFDAILEKLKEKADKYFETYITEYMSDYDITIRFSGFIDDNIEWIINRYINSQFYLTDNTTLTPKPTSSNNTTSTQPIIEDNLLFKNYNKFLELYTEFYFLLNNKKHFNSIIDLKIKTLNKNKDDNYKTNLEKLTKTREIIIRNTAGFNYTEATYNIIQGNISKISKDIETITKYEDNPLEYTKYLINILALKKDKIDKISTEKTKNKTNILENTFKSLLELSTFIDEYKSYIDDIKVILTNLKLKKSAEGPNHIEIVVDTPILYIYKIKTYEGSMYYGSDTTWCTSKTTPGGKQEYNSHTSRENLYIIQRKDDNENVQEVNNKYLLQKSNDKYQVSVTKNPKFIKDIQPSKSYAGTITINEIIEHFENDEQLISFFNEFVYNFNYEDNTLTIDISIDALYEKFTFFNTTDFIKLLNNYITQKTKNTQITIKNLIFNPNIELDLVNALKEIKEFKTLESITFGKHFNHPLGNSLGNSADSLINLQTLTFGEDFNQPLGNSLNGLINLQTLTFGEDFNQPLGDSLNGLINLKTLTFGKKFNQPLGDSLNGLINLISIDLPYKKHKEIKNNLEKQSNNLRRRYVSRRLLSKTERNTQKKQNKVNKLKEFIAPYITINNAKLPTEWEKTELYNTLNNNNNNNNNNNKNKINKPKKKTIDNMITFLSDKNKQNQ